MTIRHMIFLSAVFASVTLNAAAATPSPTTPISTDLVDLQPVSASFQEDTIQFRAAMHGFKISVPDTWEFKEGFSDEFLDFVVVGISPDEGPDDNFIENMNVLVEKIGEKITLNDYFMWNLMGLMQELPKFQIHEKVMVTVNGMPMARVVYSWDLEDQRTTTYQYIFVRGNKGYVITFSADPQQFSNLRKTFDAIATSMQFDETR